MLIQKFGGTSVGKPDRMREVAKLINDGQRKIVVLSAVSGTTNALVEISKSLYESDKLKAKELTGVLGKNYRDFVEKLYAVLNSKQAGHDLVSNHFEQILCLAEGLFSPHKERMLLAQGELISTGLFQLYLEELKIPSVLLPALNFMRIDKDGEPDMRYIEENLAVELNKHPRHTLFITQGYICRNAFGEIDNLKRGGSDYTASLAGAAANASEIQIWTDIDGMHNNDPRVVPNTCPVRRLSFAEAAELAYFGAKILHPSSVRPAKDKGIPVRLKNTMEPLAEGTLISNETSEDEIKAVAAKDGIAAIKIISGRMLLAYGFLRAVFEVFERYKTPIDMITTSEVAVSVTIDKEDHLDNIIDELRTFGLVEVDREQTIVCVVGDFLAEKNGRVVNILKALRNIPIRMISYGGSENNVSLLIHSKHKRDALIAINEGVFKRTGTEI